MKRQQKWKPYLLISPYFLIYFVFSLFPILFSFVVSFHKWSGAGDMEFVGLQNYTRLFTDGTFYLSLYNTFIIMLIALPLQFFTGLLLAVLLKDFTRRLRTPLQTINFLPYITTPVAIGILFQLLFDWQCGTINQILVQLGILQEPYNWLGIPFGAKVVVIILCYWKQFGYMMVMFLAGLSMISEDIYEAAKIDGANWFQSFFRITIPLLRPIITFVTTMSIIAGWKLFDEPQLLYQYASQPVGGPDRSVLTVVMNFYDTSFKRYDFGYGSAMAYGLFIVIFIFSVIIMKIMNKGENEA